MSILYSCLHLIYGNWVLPFEQTTYKVQHDIFQGRESKVNERNSKEQQLREANLFRMSIYKWKAKSTFSFDVPDVYRIKQNWHKSNNVIKSSMIDSVTAKTVLIKQDVSETGLTRNIWSNRISPNTGLVHTGASCWVSWVLTEITYFGFFHCFFLISWE